MIQTTYLFLETEEIPMDFTDFFNNIAIEDYGKNKNRIAELIDEINYASEVTDLDHINKFENEINLLSDIFADDPDVLLLVDCFNESKKEIEKWTMFDETKKIMKQAYIDFGIDDKTAEEEAEEFAWQELYQFS